MPIKRLGAVLVLAIGSCAWGQTNHFVPQDFPTIQAAINAASDLDTIIVQAGVYSEKFNTLGKAIRVHGTVGGTVIDATGLPSGAVATLGDAGDVTLFGENLPVLANITIRDATAPLGAAVLVESGANVTLRDVTLTSNSAPSGGALAAGFGSEVLLKSCDLNNNDATNDGGAIIALFGAVVRLEDTTLSSNHAGQYGGAIYASGADAQIVDSELFFNSADDHGGAVYVSAGAHLIQDSSINFNSTPRNGGGLYALAGAETDIDGLLAVQNSANNGAFLLLRDSALVRSRDSQYLLNTASNRGGVADVYNADFRSVGDRFVQNQAPGIPVVIVDSFGARADLVLVNAEILDNISTNQPLLGAVHASPSDEPGSSLGLLIAGSLIARTEGGSGLTSSNPSGAPGNIPAIFEIINTTITDNEFAGLRVFGAPLTRLRNSIVWNNPTQDVFAQAPGRTVTSYSIFPETATYPGTGNLNQDPLLSDINDYVPPLDSPAIDAGRTSDLPSDLLDADRDGVTILEDHPLDLLGNPRVMDDVMVANTGSGSPAVDIGAHESQRTCAADYTGDGVYDFADVLDFLARFGAMDPYADTAPAFGEFDFNDVLAFLAGFGAGCP